MDWDIGVWAPKIIKLVLCWGGVGGCGGRIILDWDTWGTQGRRCFKIEVGLGVEVWGMVVCVALAEGYDFIGDTLADEVV